MYTTVYFNPDAVGGTMYGQPLCQSGTTAPSLPGGTITPSLPLNALDAAGTVWRCGKARLLPLVTTVGLRVCRAVCARRSLEQRVPRRVCAHQLICDVSSGCCGCGTHVLWHHHQPNILPTRVLRVCHGVLQSGRRWRQHEFCAAAVLCGHDDPLSCSRSCSLATPCSNVRVHACAHGIVLPQAPAICAPIWGTTHHGRSRQSLTPGWPCSAVRLRLVREQRMPDGLRDDRLGEPVPDRVRCFGPRLGQLRE